MTADDDSSRVIDAIHAGDLDALRALLTARPGLAASRLGGPAGARTPLHVVTDWPGYPPNGPTVARMLIEAGADVDAGAAADGTGETPLHWAASNDDVDVAAVLIDGGADVEAPDGSIGTPLDNAIGYGCWHVARLLVARGARVDALWHASALGLLDRLEELLDGELGADPERVSQAFWHACAGGQRRAAEMLLDRGADLNWVPEYSRGTPLDAARDPGTRRAILVKWLERRGARPAPT
jgi:ankyrin repeat protein